MTTIPRRRVIIIDDHALFRTGLNLLLQRDKRIEVIGEGETGNDAVTLSHQHHPDVVLLDVELGDDPVEKTLSRLLRVSPRPSVIVLTMHQDSVLKRQLIAAGASDYITKNNQGPELVAAILKPRDAPQPALEKLSKKMGSTSPLSERELQVLWMIGQVQTNRQIGVKLSITESTVKRHATNIYVKLGATSRMDAVRRATRMGLFKGRSDMLSEP